MNWVETFSLLDPRVRKGTWIVMAVGILALWWWRGRKLRWQGQLIIAAIGVLTGVLGWLIVDVIWSPFADPIGRYTWICLGIAGLTVALACARPRTSAEHGRRAVEALRIARDAVVLILVLSAALLAVNGRFMAFTTVADLLGTNVHTVDLDDTKTADPTVAPAGQTLTDAWSAPADMPAHGTLSRVDIPGEQSDFNARDALIYLPPAYLTDQRPLLPVLVMLAGQPGKPDYWVTGGNLTRHLDEYAAAHDGLAPVVVIPDPLGASFTNPLCSDTPKTNAGTYLEVDVPNWIKTNLQVDTNPEHWSVGGISNGGTCSLQLVTRAPGVYTHFLDMSGELQPSLGNTQKTIDHGFGGDAELFAKNDPATLMERNRYPQISGIFSVGDTDTKYGPAAVTMNDAAQASGMTTELRTYPGAHSWYVWSAAFRDQLPWLASQTGLSDD